MEKARILIVDDSIVVRRLLSDALSAEPTIEVAGTAPNGRIALTKIPQINPDLVTLDVEMPELDGIATLREIRKLYPKLPVIMFSTLTERGAAATIDALSLGANDYVAKPANVGSIAAGLQQIRSELVPKIKALTGHSNRTSFSQHFVQRSQAGTTVAHQRFPAPLGEAKRVNQPLQRVNILAIGTSTGGPNALAALIPLIPRDFPVPIVIVQHMPPMFTRLLAENLASKSQIPITEAQSGDILVPGRAWIAPGDFHMTVAKRGDHVQICTHQGLQENSCRPAVDALFRSVAAVYGPNALGVVLTGMGQDGMRGSESICGRGGQVIVQDEPSSVVWGMAGSVFRAGLADEVLPIGAIIHSILRRVGQWRARSFSAPAVPFPR